MYDFDPNCDWFSDHIPAWQDVLNQTQLNPQKVLEIGAYEGRASTWIMEHLLPDGGELYCVDTWEGSPEHDQSKMSEVEHRWCHNILEASTVSKAKAHHIKTTSQMAMAALLTRGDAGSFDMIYIDGSHHAKDVLADLTLAFALAKAGGLLIVDDYYWYYGIDPRHTPKMAVDAFTSIYSEHLRPIMAHPYQTYLLLQLPCGCTR